MSENKIVLNNESESTEDSESSQGNIIIHQDEPDCLSDPGFDGTILDNDEDIEKDLEELSSSDNSYEEEYFSDESFDSNLSFDELDEEFLNNLDSDSDIDLKTLIKFGYLIDIDGHNEIRLEVKDEKVIDTGLVTGLTQCDELVDANFISNSKMKELNNDISFDKEYINANGKQYKYNEINVQMSPHEAVIVSTENNEFIIKLEDDTHDMFSSLVGEEEDNTCIISVIDSKICACYISDSEIVWVNPIDIGKNKFDEEKSIITTRKKEKFSLEDCYLRACIKKIYLHVDNNNPPRTLILGKTDNPFYEDSVDDSYESDMSSSESEKLKEKITEKVSVKVSKKVSKTKNKTNNKDVIKKNVDV